MLAILVLAGSGTLPAAPGAPGSVDQAIRELGDEEFKKRTAAQEQLLAWGRENIEDGIERFYKVYRTHDDPEVRVRSRELLKELVVEKSAVDGEGYIGIMMREDAVPRPGGGIRRAVRVTAVIDDTPAQKAKLREGDLVLGIDDRDLAAEGSMEAFGAYVRSKKPADKVTLHVQRINQKLDIEVELMRRPNLPQNNLQLFGGELRMPPVEEQEESAFQAWLRKRLEEEKNGGR
ncbi:MAG: PDZ domain-containing protein [Akkermansiaceae bacterium]|nr:PDZ domain-containing protein [Akkermansiaceae bacterium]